MEQWVPQKFRATWPSLMNVRQEAFPPQTVGEAVQS
ncbi:hypothetical protein STIAU_1170 [Stigmatella aurantiaca DW4/3-1]|uniref:Uncharacterized protein n=1 Tax=Stigmatella aurantiaca (strain DW4/3-1) TaxID=378806 RepID=Q08XH5_STIAD|nr:hypothetical protein STIAU_1170 [Stigmatella aurantiaca DW4/3-1]